ncbi:MAG: hypothetical protein HFI70_15080 [Lachnospiraceae bacterium]|nr:hypothetical protein [Lachnospiraceae bacterium]
MTLDLVESAVEGDGLGGSCFAPSSALDNDNLNPVPIGDGFGFLVYLEC